MFFRSIASAFFLEASVRDDLATLVRRAGMVDGAPFNELERAALGFHQPDSVVLGGAWGAFHETWAIVDDLDEIRCLQLYSPATRYLDAVGAARDQGDAEDGPLQGYVRTFHDACLSLTPRAAFLDTRPHYEDEEWENKQDSRTIVLAYAPLVAAFDANALAARFFSVLYLNNEMLARWSPEPLWHDRDMVEMSTGRLIFARGGPARMA